MSDEPMNDDPYYFLQRARPEKGEEHVDVVKRWNAWRRDPANDGVPVDFSEVDFTAKENRMISFAGFEFGDNADFSGATFNSEGMFINARFGLGASFVETMFLNGADFSKAVFGSHVRFDRAIFTGRTTKFCSALFEGPADFRDTVFLMRVDFEGSIFKRAVSFINTAFRDCCCFEQTIFGGRADFSCDPDASFVWLHGLSKRHSPDGETHSNLRMPRFTKLAFDTGSVHRNIPSATFSRARFVGKASFDNRVFDGITDYSSVEFRSIPTFDGVDDLSRLDFSAVLVVVSVKNKNQMESGDLIIGDELLQLRILRSQVEATKNHDFERDLFIEERRAERGILSKQYWDAGRYLSLASHLVWIAVMALYWAFADYGRSWVRPAVWLVVSLLAFHGVGSVEGIDAWLLSERRAAAIERVVGDEARTAVAAQYDEAVRLYSVANSIPFVGPLTVDGDVKKFLFCGETGKGVETAAASAAKAATCVPLPPRGFQLATIGQNLLSILLVFFMGLALRNYFRLK